MNPKVLVSDAYDCVRAVFRRGVPNYYRINNDLIVYSKEENTHIDFVQPKPEDNDSDLKPGDDNANAFVSKMDIILYIEGLQKIIKS